MNTCMCDRCKPGNSHYSFDYHREEGFDTQHRYDLQRYQERILELSDKLRKIGVLIGENETTSAVDRGSKPS